jgi:hypothetical protein
MKRRRWKIYLAALCVSGIASVAIGEEPTLFRVFMRDGTALVSYGEVARVGSNAVFSMPTGASRIGIDTQLHLVNIPAAQIDWERTSRYAESARATHYLRFQAPFDYIALSNEVAQTLETVALTNDPAVRLSIVEGARKKLAAWPKAHYNYNEAEVQQMLVFLDGAIADLRSTTGTQRLDLSFVATPPEGDPAPVPLMPPPTLKESIEMTIAAARLTDVSAERAALLSIALTNLNTHASTLPREWVAATAASTNAQIEAERQTDSLYRSLTAKTLKAAVARAQAADVKSLERILADVPAADQSLGTKRPEIVNGLVAAVREQLEAAQKLRLARDHWAGRLPALREYREAVDLSLIRLATLTPWLEDIKLLAGSSPATIAAVHRTAGRVLNRVQTIAPPDELRSAHALLTSAANLADNAAALRERAVREHSISVAWDASAAAAGALMLSAQARREIDAMLRRPQLPQ